MILNEGLKPSLKGSTMVDLGVDLGGEARGFGEGEVRPHVSKPRRVPRLRERLWQVSAGCRPSPPISEGSFVALSAWNP